MRILVVAWHPQYVLRLYESTLRALAAAGHTIHLGFTSTTVSELRTAAGEFLDALCAEFPTITYGTFPDRADVWVSLLDQVRGARTALAYQHVWFDGSPNLRARAREGLWPLTRGLLRTPVVRARGTRSLLDWLLRAIEAAVPHDARAADALLAQSPDMLFVTPLVHPPARQTDYLKSALMLGLPAMLGVASWDNLTTKGFIQLPPDALLVWNEAQRREAVEIHRMPAERVVVTGAQVYDQWFDPRPSTTRDEFCRRRGLDPTAPLLLYLCSSRFFQDDERQFIRKWLTAVRGSAHPVLRRAGVVIRPYPTAGRHVWADFDLAPFGNAVVWPLEGQAPLAPQAKDAYLDSLYHSAAVVAANTSGLIEAGIVGRRCFSLLAPEFAQKQAGMPHFSYLKDSGFLVTAASLEEHLDQLQHELAGAGGGRERMTEFLASFIRPHGLERPATPIVVEAIQQFAKHAPRRPQPAPAWLLPLRWLLVGPAVACRARDLTCGAVRGQVKRWFGGAKRKTAKPATPGVTAEQPSHRRRRAA